MLKKSNCRSCRRAGEKLFLKGEKCNLPTCPFLKRSYPPGQAGAKRRLRRGSDYSKQLAEKQKARAIYGLSEKQMQNLFVRARKTKSKTAQKLVQFLETRLGNVVYRSSWGVSRDEARQLIIHGKISVNGKMVKSPSYQLGIGDKISMAAGFEPKVKRDVPSWLKANKANETEVLLDPTKDNIQEPYDEQLIIEYYSR